MTSTIPLNSPDADRAASGRKPALGPTAISLAAITIAAKIMGLAEKAVVAHFFGASASADVYFVATTLLLSAVFLARELIYPSLLPTLSGAMAESSSAFAGLLGRVMVRAGACLVLISAAALAFIPWATELLAPGFSQSQRDLTTHLLRWLLPAGFLLGLLTVTYTALNARGRFVIAAVADAGAKVVCVLGMLLMVPRMGINAVAATLCVAAAVCLAFHMAFLPGVGQLLRPAPPAAVVLGAKAMKLMGPLVIGVVFSHVNAIIENVLASRLPGGQLSLLGYARKIIDAALLIGPAALVTVLFARMSHLASLGRGEELSRLLAKGFRLLVFLSLPASFLLLELDRPLVGLLLQHGQFDAVATAGTGDALRCYAFGFVALSLEALCVCGFYAMSDTRTPVAMGVACVGLDVGLALLLVPRLQYLGIAWAFVIAKTVKVAVLMVWLHLRTGRRLFGGQWLAFAAKAAAATATLWVVLRYSTAPIPQGHFLTIFAKGLFLPGALSITAFIGVSLALGLEECRLCLAAISPAGLRRRICNTREADL